MLASLASAAPVPVQVGGRDLLLSPLSDRDFDELSLWYQVRVLQIARASFTPENTPQEREETMRAACAQAASIDFLSEFGSGGIQAASEATAQFVWRLFRKHPKNVFTLDDARRLVRSGESIQNIMDDWQFMQYGKVPENKTEGGENPGKNDDAAVPAPGP